MIFFVFDLCFYPTCLVLPLKKTNDFRQTCMRRQSLLSSSWWWKICTAAKRCLASSLFRRGDTNWKNKCLKHTHTIRGGSWERVHFCAFLKEQQWYKSQQSWKTIRFCGRFHEQMGWLKLCFFFNRDDPKIGQNFQAWDGETRTPALSIPGTQMTLGLVWKGFVLRGLPSK